jgi:ferritin
MDLEQLTIRSLKKGLHMAEDFWTNHFMDWCLKLDFEMEAVMATLIRRTRICRRWQSN